MMRSLPEKHNPLIEPGVSPDFAELLSRRRLGRTNLSVKPGQIGTSNATLPENLGVFEYAHLRAPLPRNLKGSEIFSSKQAQNPETYFLMRRSRDGYVSATGMFKIAFPWAKHTEELKERDYLKTREGTSEDEVAGNVWISPELALDVGKEYDMFDWVRALLDPSEIPQSTAGTSPDQRIVAPPKFEAPSIENPVLAPSVPETRGRTRRSASPSKSVSAARKIATPRKSRQTRAQKESSAAPSISASTSLQTSLDAAAASVPEQSGAEEEKTEEQTEVNGERAESEAEEQIIPVKKSKDQVTVNVESTVDSTGGGQESSRTNVSVEMPSGLPQLPLPEDTEEMIAKAKEMVEEATKLQEEQKEAGDDENEDEEEDATAGSSSKQAAKKRKAEELIEEGEMDGADDTAQPAKRAKVLEDRLRRERVRNRALFGVTATLAMAAAIPYFF